MKELIYQPPTVEIVRIGVESGFAASLTGTGVDPTLYNTDYWIL